MSAVMVSANNYFMMTDNATWNGFVDKVQNQIQNQNVSKYNPYNSRFSCKPTRLDG